MTEISGLEVWFLTGSQHLYGDEALKQVAANSRTIAESLAAEKGLPVKVVFKPVLTRPEEVRDVCREANNSASCIGLVLWMHTFSPAKMWIAGLSLLRKPFVHLHTQFGRDLPWSSIDMDFMNLHQSAHGDREFGHITSRLRLPRKVVVGFWQDAETVAEIGVWMRAALGWHESQNLKIARFGDNMRDVAVTEGDKVEAQARLGYSVYAFGIGDLVAEIKEVTDAEVGKLLAEYREVYTIHAGHDKEDTLKEAARIELGLRAFLVKGGFGAFTDNFQDLHGMDQLPGVAVQRLMADGYGFGGEGDWKTAGLVRTMKVMATGMKGGTSFMEDYTYDFGTGSGAAGPKVLGSHMLEVCPSISSGKPTLEVHPLSIGGKADPARLVFTADNGPAILASMVDMGNRFRMVVNEVEVIPPSEDLPKLPVARAVWLPKPNMKVAAAAWIYAGGAHHNGFSLALTAEHIEDFCEIAGIEFLRIGEETKIDAFRKELRWNDAAYLLKS